MRASVTGLNHLTLAVADIARSIAFYRDLLGCSLRTEWPDRACLDAGTLWLCPSRDDRTVPYPDNTHVAFTVADDGFTALSPAVRAGCMIWKVDSSEGTSLYFLDPDGHRLELNVGTLETRLAHCRAQPAKDIRIF